MPPKHRPTLHQDGTLWVGGLLLAVPGMALLWPSLERERLELLAYVLFGSVFPLSLFWLSVRITRADERLDRVRGFRLALAAGLIAAGCAFSFLRFQAMAWVAVLVHCGLFWLTSTGLQRDRFRVWIGDRARWLRMLPVAVAMVLAWSAAGELFYWEELDDLATAGGLSLLAFVACIALAAFALRPAPGRVAAAPTGRQFAVRAWDAVAVSGLAALSLNTAPLLVATAFPHWGCFTGPAQLVRQGVGCYGTFPPSMAS